MARALVYFLESDFCIDSRKPLEDRDAKQFLIRREILRAVASHTCEEVYYLPFDDLPFLLFLVDELQESGRPTLDQRSGVQGSKPREDWGIELRGVSISDDRSSVHVKQKAGGAKRQEISNEELAGIKTRLRLAVHSPSRPEKKEKERQFRFHVQCSDGTASLTLGKQEDGRIGIWIDPPPKEEGKS
jgi:hypothetical protein